MKWVKCEKCGCLSDRMICFSCSGEKNKTSWRKNTKKKKEE